MFALPGLAGLLLVLYLRPQEYYTVLQHVPLIYLFFALALGGLLIDLKVSELRRSPNGSGPMAVVPTAIWASAFWVWCMVVIAVKVPGDLKLGMIKEVTTLLVACVLVSHSAHSLRGFRVIVATLVIVALFLAAVAVHQSVQPRSCIRITGVSKAGGASDGRFCEYDVECMGEDAEPGIVYECERAGLLGTTTVSDRVRYRGELNDPNELALVLSAAVPLLLALIGSTIFGRALAVLGVLLLAAAILATQSRGGLLALVAALAVYLSCPRKRLSPMRLALFALAGLFLGPIVSSLGRSGANADASTMGRYEAWREGFAMFVSDPVFGVGPGMFIHHHYLTAHNSFVLAGTELGLMGMFLWVSLIYITVKIPVAVLRDFRDDPRARTARAWACALLAMSAAYLVQMMFLSVTYHTATWVFIGLSGACHAAAKRHAPTWRVALGLWDMLFIAFVSLGFFPLLHVFLAWRGF